MRCLSRCFSGGHPRRAEIPFCFLFSFKPAQLVLTFALPTVCAFRMHRVSPTSCITPPSYFTRNHPKTAVRATRGT